MFSFVASLFVCRVVRHRFVCSLSLSFRAKASNSRMVRCRFGFVSGYERESFVEY